MTLDDFLKSGAMTPAALARKTGLSAASITRILFGEQNASHDAIKAIVKATRGKVTAHDLIFGLPRDPSEKRRIAA
jgi:transcriptional regulator with XRE-family HTH domain